MIDTLTRVETPEGIALRLRAAGVFPRAAAWAIDFLIRVAIGWALATVLLLLGESGLGIYLIAIFVLLWLYPVLFEVLRDGQTIGKKALGLRVINANGTPVTWTASIVRNLLRVVDSLPFAYGFGVAALLIDPHNRRIGDMVAGTLVVHTEAPFAHAQTPDVPVVHPVLVLEPAERIALVAFGERARQLTIERQRELASLLPMLTDAHDDVAVQRLLGMANAVLGRH
jgi:uncharacterized RDD family membrane protein YckC